jgi:tRNA-binding protein
MTELSAAEAVGEIIDFGDFLKVDIRVGTVVSARLNERARKPAYVLDIDFGDLGVRRSSAQIVANYELDALVGRKVVAVVNFPAKKVAGVVSEVLVLAAVCPRGGTLLIRPDGDAGDGVRVL